jgi:hypothetical protein
MLGSKTETPFADWPKTKALKDGGFHVTGSYLHPTTRRTADGFGILFGVIAFFSMISAVRSPGDLFGFAILAFIIAGITSWVLRSWLHKNLDIKVHPDKIMVGGRWGYKTYPRNVRMEFRVERHRKAGEEALEEHRKGERQAMVYRQAVEVVLQYGERRVVLAEMREKDVEKANALAFRLQDICESQNEALQQLLNEHVRPIDPVPGAWQPNLPPQRSAPGEFGPEPEIR